MCEGHQARSPLEETRHRLAECGRYCGKAFSNLVIQEVKFASASCMAFPYSVPPPASLPDVPAGGTAEARAKRCMLQSSCVGVAVRRAFQQRSGCRWAVGKSMVERPCCTASKLVKPEPLPDREASYMLAHRCTPSCSPPSAPARPPQRTSGGHRCHFMVLCIRLSRKCLMACEVTCSGRPQSRLLEGREVLKAEPIRMELLARLEGSGLYPNSRTTAGYSCADTPANCLARGPAALVPLVRRAVRRHASWEACCMDIARLLRGPPRRGS